MKFKITGGAEMAARLKQYGEQLKKDSRKAVADEATAILAEAKNRVPVDTGALRASGHVMLDETEAKARIVFDGEYAVVVHEDLTAHHPQGEAKFLERPLNEARGSMGERLAATIKK